ncbi:hypothetical protein E4U58_003413 [Claviceps cyperi]|nr:hypothetical protein E4U58_003413 [Claviceps cyperi]
MAISTRREKITEEVTPGPEVEDFANALDDCLLRGLAAPEKRARLLDLPRKYHENAIRRLAQVQPKVVRHAADDVNMDMDAEVDAVAVAKIDKQHPKDGPSGSSDDVRQLEKEVQTWDLFRRLLPLRYSGSGPEPMRFSSPLPGSRKSIQDDVHEFLETNSIALERRAVLQWLQTTAATGPDIDEVARELQQNADRGDIIAHGWLHTRTKIKLRKSVTAWPRLLDRQSPNEISSHVNSDGAPLVTQLDPDASTRQGRKLEPQDDYFERAIWLGCFEHLRRGSKFDDIREWCRERTEMWRAISMSAMPMSVEEWHDGPKTDADAASLALWRRTCFSLARQGSSDDFERAVYGILSGDITTVENVARSWDDFLFANYNALLRSQIDTFVLSKCPPDVVSTLLQSLPAFDAVEFHGDDNDVQKRIIQTIGSHPQVRTEASEPNKALQASFIAKELDRHLYEQGLVITAAANEFSTSRLVRKGLEEDENTIVSKYKYFDLAQHSGLRIVAHVFVLVSLLNRFERQESDSLEPQIPASWRFFQENILAAYTDYLRRAKLRELIPLYCSVFNTPRRYEALSWNVIEQSDLDVRGEQLGLIRRAGIDDSRFVESQATLFFGELDNNPELAVNNASFRILEPGPPSSRGQRRMKNDFFGAEEDKVDPKDMNMIRALEWLLMVEKSWPQVFSIGIQVYKLFLRNGRLSAARRLYRRVAFTRIMQHMTGHDDPEITLYEDVEFWTLQLQDSRLGNVKPEQAMSDARNYMELEALVKALDTLETIASCVHISEDPNLANKQFWQRVGEEITTATDNMQPLLKNWLLPGIENGDHELKQLRDAYLPETVLAYISALHFAGTGISRDHLLECMDLASVIAERNSDLSATFMDAQRMKELVEALTACSKTLAIKTEEKRGATVIGGRKLRELGWSRDLWAVKK